MGPLGVDIGFGLVCDSEITDWGPHVLGHRLHWSSRLWVVHKWGACVYRGGTVAMLSDEGVGESEASAIVQLLRCEPAGNQPMQDSEKRIQLLENAIYIWLHWSGPDIWMRCDPTLSGAAWAQEVVVYIAWGLWQRGNYRKWVGWGHQEVQWP